MAPHRLFWTAFFLAVALRAVLVGLVLRAEGCDLAAYAHAADGSEVLAVARGWRGDLDAVRREPFYQGLVASGGLGSSHLIRFGVTPAVVAAAESVGLPTAAAATIPFWLLSGLAAGLAAVWLADLRAGILLAALPPIYLYSTSFSDASPWMLAAAIAAFMAASRGAAGVSGVLAGLACWVRPEGTFVVVGSGLLLLQGAGWKAVSRYGLAAAAAVLAGALIVVGRFHELLTPILTAPGTGSTPGFLDLPGAALYESFTRGHLATWKLVYVGAHLLVLATACALLARQALGRRLPEDRRQTLGLLAWAGLQFVFILSLRGSQGFDELPRYASLCLPAVVAAYLPFLPRRRTWTIALVFASFLIATLPARKNLRPACMPLSRPAALSQMRR